MNGGQNAATIPFQRPSPQLVFEPPFGLAPARH
jgi:hypothetical protein